MPQRWRNRSPGDLSIELDEIEAMPVEPAVAAVAGAAREWARTPLNERADCLRKAQAALAVEKENLARGIAIETGKPITEARGELSAVLAKFDFTIEDAEQHLAQREVVGGPNPAFVRQGARGPAVVIAPFNFPLHLGNGALLAHLAAGNPVIFKPSPLAAVVAERYSEVMRGAFPPDVFSLVQGGAEEAQALCLDPRVRAVCFTGSVPVGRALAKAVAEDYSKELALELGGRNATIVCADADVDLAARAIADGICLTCGQRCNATSRILVDARIAAALAEKLAGELAKWVPGDPLDDATKLGPLINEAAVQRYAGLLAEHADWLVPGRVIGGVCRASAPLAGGSAPAAGGAPALQGHYVLPAIRRGAARADVESFVPIADFDTFTDLDEAVAKANASPFGMTASIFTRSRETFAELTNELRVANLYANLPTTFSPSALPFGGWGLSGNGRPGGRGFIRFCTSEQAIQLGKDTFAR
jgi:acyl-CoA reductase-like NAD-dependent aldehyde dehydrogenase